MFAQIESNEKIVRQITANERWSYVRIRNMQDISATWIFLPRQIARWIAQEVHHTRHTQWAIVVLVEITIFVMFQCHGTWIRLHFFAQFFRFTANVENSVDLKLTVIQKSWPSISLTHSSSLSELQSLDLLPLALLRWILLSHFGCLLRLPWTISERCFSCAKLSSILLRPQYRRWQHFSDLISLWLR